MIYKASALVEPAPLLPASQENPEDYGAHWPNIDKSNIDGYYTFPVFLIVDQFSLISLESGDGSDEDGEYPSHFEETWHCSNTAKVMYESAIAELSVENPGAKKFWLFVIDAKRGEKATVRIENETLYISAETLESIRRGSLPEAEIPQDLQQAVIHRHSTAPAPKSRNSYVRTIAALGQALLKKPLAQPHKDAGAILAALAAEGIEPPVKEDALANYLKAAGEVEKKAKG